MEYKGRTDSNSPTGPNKAVCLATPSLPPAKAGRKRK